MAYDANDRTEITITFSEPVKLDSWAAGAKAKDYFDESVLGSGELDNSTIEPVTTTGNDDTGYTTWKITLIDTDGSATYKVAATLKLTGKATIKDASGNALSTKNGDNAFTLLALDDSTAPTATFQKVEARSAGNGYQLKLIFSEALHPTTLGNTNVAEIINYLSVDGTVGVRDGKGTRVIANAIAWDTAKSANPVLIITLPNGTALQGGKVAYVELTNKGQRQCRHTKPDRRHYAYHHTDHYGR